MKLVPKLSLAFIAGTSLILAVNGYLRVQREVTLFESDRIHDDELIGRTLGAATSRVWQSDGEKQALSIVMHAGEKEGRVRVRWVWLDGSNVPALPIDPDAVTRLRPGDASTHIAKSGEGEDRRYTFVRVAVPDLRRGAIEVSESLETERAYIRRTVIDTVVTTLTLDAFCAALAMILGVWLVGRPVAALMEKARRVGLGDFASPLRLKQNDELAELAGEMNAMSDRLVAANARAAEETRARIQMVEQLRHADRLMTVGKLASGIAHELGTPLNVVEARASMIAAGETSPDESRSYAGIVVRATEQMTRIIRQLLEFARPRAAQKSRCDLRLVAKRTVELLKPLADKRNVVLRLDENGSDGQADADAGQMEQVLTNLVMNAIQSMTHAGTVEVTVQRAHPTPPPDHDPEGGEYLELRVRDEGHGIPPDQLPHVFEPFFTTKDVGEGTGLGLSVTYGIVREHGGWITVESEPERGSVFSVFLPSAVNA